MAVITVNTAINHDDLSYLGTTVTVCVLAGYSLVLTNLDICRVQGNQKGLVD